MPKIRGNDGGRMGGCGWRERISDPVSEIFREQDWQRVVGRYYEETKQSILVTPFTSHHTNQEHFLFTMFKCKHHFFYLE